MDSRERWLLTVQTGGWLIRDADSGRDLVCAPDQKTLAANFSADGTNILAWTRTGLQRWPLVVAPGSGKLTVGPPDTVWRPAGGALNLAVFAAGQPTDVLHSGGAGDRAGPRDF